MHHEPVENRELDRLLHYIRLQDADCPVGRHELLDDEWIALGAVKAERTRLETEWQEAQQGRMPGEGNASPDRHTGD